MYRIDDYDFPLPEDRIAQHPHPERDRSRLMVLDRATGDLAHQRFDRLPELLRPQDVLVINDTQVVPARLTGRKDTGGRVEVLVLDYAGARGQALSGGTFVSDCLVRASKRPREGGRLFFGDELEAEVIACGDDTATLRFRFAGDVDAVFDRWGTVPLPPYIRRPADACDRESYQTVYASEKGAVAAPTAGLHFTRSLMEALRNKGVAIVRITLHVGYGTFLPVRVSDIRDHRMHAERFTVDPEAADVVAASRRREGRVVAVGTTCVRTLEFLADGKGGIRSGSGSCDLFIYPGHQFKVVDAMITNFHLPKSTLLMLVSAFAGFDAIRTAYREAVREGYRFFSYGDAMFIV
ncbi:MAG: tRNA preQ1(34) S-adenosylmethionine ribosyltransferase-isomerase QueA [Desulfobacteraceae bacterium]|nr:tRNA preQ1(34) S-adenosylmethionine ribosyltransferase-isomerase QueA [Desulfobacteraceae bacterium]